MCNVLDQKLNFHFQNTIINTKVCQAHIDPKFSEVCTCQNSLVLIIAFYNPTEEVCGKLYQSRLTQATVVSTTRSIIHSNTHYVCICNYRSGRCGFTFLCHECFLHLRIELGRNKPDKLVEQINGECISHDIPSLQDRGEGRPDQLHCNL